MNEQLHARKVRGCGCLSGCAGGCLVILILIGIAAFLLFNTYKTFLDRFERAGYDRVQEQFVRVEQSLEKPTVFIGQRVIIEKGSSRGIAILAKEAEINGRVKGNVHFIGQTLTIHKGSELMYDLDVKAQTVNLYGVVEGEITGNYGILNRRLPR